jgi:hypothetical protein
MKLTQNERSELLRQANARNGRADPNGLNSEARLDKWIACVV